VAGQEFKIPNKLTTALKRKPEAVVPHSILYIIQNECHRFKNLKKLNHEIPRNVYKSNKKKK
jgi:hypothetical protein